MVGTSSEDQKNLKISSLKRNGIDNPEAIAKIARQGVGIMSGYEDELGDNGDQIVANWVWEQAQKSLGPRVNFEISPYSLSPVNVLFDKTSNIFNVSRFKYPKNISITFCRA